MMFGKRQTTLTTAAPERLTHDALIVKRRAIEADQTRQLDALRPAIQAAEAECAAHQAKLQTAQQAYRRATEAYRVVAHQFERGLADNEAELRVIPMPAIDRFVEEIDEEIKRLHREGHRSRTIGTVVDGRGQRHPIVHTNYDGHRELGNQLWAAKQAAEALRYSATEADLPGDFQKLRDALDYALLEKYDGPNVPSGDPIFAA